MTVDMWITVGIAALLLIFVIRGAFRGLSGEVAPLVGLIVCGFVIFFGYSPMHALVDSFVSEEHLRHSVFFSALGISLVGIFCYFLVSAFVRKVFEWILPQPFNAILGALLSGAKGVLFISIAAGLYTLTQEKIETIREQQDNHPLAKAAATFWKARVGQAGDDLGATAKIMEEALKEKTN